MPRKEIWKYYASTAEQGVNLDFSGGNSWKKLSENRDGALGDSSKVGGTRVRG